MSTHRPSSSDDQSSDLNHDHASSDKALVSDAPTVSLNDHSGNADADTPAETVTRFCVSCGGPIIVHDDSDAAYGDTIRCSDGQGCDDPYMSEDTFVLTDDMIRGARDMGVLAAKCAASWTCDGNTSAEGIRWALKLADDGDPRLDECLPARPDLSGQWASDLTPQHLVADIIGWDTLEALSDDVRTDTMDTLANAWEDGVSDTFEDACVAELRASLPDSEA